MDATHALKETGLSDGESAVYLALLQLGPSPVSEVAAQAGLKRPTVYLILDELMRRGLATLVPQEKKKLYIAASPENILEDITRRKEIIENILPTLSALHKKRVGQPSIRILEGAGGIRTAYREITAETKGEIVGFFTLGGIPKEVEICYELFLKEFSRGRKMREIIRTEDINHWYLKRARRFPNYEARLTDKSLVFPTDNIIAGNTVALFSFEKRFALMIENADLAISLRSLFELAWASAQKI